MIAEHVPEMLALYDTTGNGELSTADDMEAEHFN